MINNFTYTETKQLIKTIGRFKIYEKWKHDAKMDGRGHSLAMYDGCELYIDDLAMFRI